jgi:hypothetical protein
MPAIWTRCSLLGGPPGTARPLAECMGTPQMPSSRLARSFQVSVTMAPPQSVPESGAWGPERGAPPASPAHALPGAPAGRLGVSDACPVPPDPFAVLKKRKRDEDWATKKAAAATEAKAKAVATRKEIFKRAEQYVKEYRTQVGRCARWGRMPLCCRLGSGRGRHGWAGSRDGSAGQAAGAASGRRCGAAGHGGRRHSGIAGPLRKQRQAAGERSWRVLELGILQGKWPIIANSASQPGGCSGAGRPKDSASCGAYVRSSIRQLVWLT